MEKKILPLDEIVSSVKRVSDIIGEITAASTEQSQGIGEINGAVNQLDQMTQQNAALVEEWKRKSGGQQEIEVTIVAVDVDALAASRKRNGAADADRVRIAIESRDNNRDR